MPYLLLQSLTDFLVLVLCNVHISSHRLNKQEQITLSKHLKTIKALGLRPRAFISFLVFGNPDETLALVFEILHLRLSVAISRKRKERLINCWETRKSCVIAAIEFLSNFRANTSWDFCLHVWSWFIDFKKAKDHPWCMDMIAVSYLASFAGTLCMNNLARDKT